MSKSRLEWKVGLFVLIGLVLLGALLLQFSKGLTVFRPTYDIYLDAPNVGGLKANAGVLMSGVQIGTVADIKLRSGATNVTVTLRILDTYVIHKDAKFVMEQSGFLGDQYVAVVPTENKLPPFEDGETAQAEAPFNLQEFTRSATGFISRVDETVKKLNEALTEVSRMLLNPETLTNVSVTVANLRTFSDRALTTIDEVNLAIATNAPSLSTSSSNLVHFSERLNQFAAQLNDVVSTNTDDIGRIVDNVEASTESLKLLVADLQTGKGLAGDLLKDEQLANKASEIARNLSITTSNLSITSSNLNRLGLWRMLWRPKPPKTQAPATADRLVSPKANR